MGRLQSTGLIILGVALWVVSPAYAQPVNIEDQINHCRYNGHRDQSCEYLCYDLNVREACQILENRRHGGGNRGRDLLVNGIVSGIVNGVITSSRNRRSQQGSQQQIQPQSANQPSAQYSNEHYKYCLNRYKTYQIPTNSYTSLSGQTRYCNSPFD